MLIQKISKPDLIVEMPLNDDGYHLTVKKCSTPTDSEGSTLKLVP